MNRRTQLRLFGLWCKLNVLGGLDRPGNLALKAFLQPPPPRIRPKQAAFLATATRQSFAFEGVSIAVYEWGDSEAPYVFTDIGWGYNAGRWRHFTPHLVAAGYRVLAFDPPGHGHSPYVATPYPARVRLQRALMEHYGRPSLALTHSFGAGCLPEALAGLPPHQRPDRVVLLAPFSDIRYIFRQLARALGFGRLAYGSLKRATERLTGRTFASMDPALSAQDLGGVPALLVHDPEDEVTAVSNGERLHAHWPNSQLLYAPGAGHNISTPQISQQILAWLLNGELPAFAKTEEHSTQASSPGRFGKHASNHELARAFRELELDLVHGSFASAYFS